MSLQFTKATATCGDRSAVFLTMGIPKEKYELDGYTAFDDFMENIPDEADVHVSCIPYTYGDGDSMIATVEEVAYLTMRMQSDPKFLERRCNQGTPYTMNFHKGLDNKHEVQFGDEGFLLVPNKPIDCSKLGYFDAMEEECWELIKSYAERLGIDILPGEDGEEAINFDLAKRIQDTILNEFMMAGVEMKFSDEGIGNSEEVRTALRNMDKDDMFVENIYEFETIDEVFNYFYDEEVSKRTLVEKLSTNEKFELISEYIGDRILHMDGKYYVNNESFDTLDTEYYTQNGGLGNISM